MACERVNHATMRWAMLSTITPKPSNVRTPSKDMSPGSTRTTSSTVSKPSALTITYPVSRVTICFVAVVKLRLRTGFTPMPVKRSLGNHVNSDPVSTSTSIRGLTRDSSLMFRATTLTLNML